MKAKIVKTDGCSKKDVAFVTKNCRKCDIFLSFSGKCMFKLLGSDLPR